MSCLFCGIVSGEIDAEIVWRNDTALAFLDNRPLFQGHVLLIPANHVVTLTDLPVAQVGPLFEAAQIVQGAVEKAMDAEGTFIAVNNRVSQSVPHLHIHIVPRHKGDGLKGFFWPRRPYTNRDEMKAAADRIRECLLP